MFIVASCNPLTLMLIAFQMYMYIQVTKIHIERPLSTLKQEDMALVPRVLAIISTTTSIDATGNSAGAPYSPVAATARGPLWLLYKTCAFHVTAFRSPKQLLKVSATAHDHFDDADADGVDGHVVAVDDDAA